MAQYSGGFGYASIGNIHVANRAINQVHRDYNLPEFTPSSLQLSGGGFGVIKNFMIGGEGSVITAGSINGPGFNSSLATAYGMVQVGILTSRYRDRVLVYPVVGIGRGVSSYNNKTSAPFFETDYSAISEQLFMKVELNIAAYPFTLNKKGQHGGLFSSLSIGYLMNPQSASFEAKNNQAFPFHQGIGPSPYTSGLYFKICIGGGGIGKPKIKKEK